jgi:hypothetical protein
MMIIAKKKEEIFYLEINLIFTSFPFDLSMQLRHEQGAPTNFVVLQILHLRSEQVC